MAFALSSSCTVSHCNVIHQLKSLRNDPRLHYPNLAFVRCNFRYCVTKINSCSRIGKKPHRVSRLIARSNSDSDLIYEESGVVSDWGNQGLLEEDDDDEGSPWEGAIVYKRNPSISHVENCTTLERLGLGKLSTEISRKRASVMGLKVTKEVNKDYPDGTPVLVSMDITRKKHKLRLDGIIRTVLSLGCNRCGEAAAESIFSNFSLLLSEEPIEEPETIVMGTIFGEDKFRTSGNSEEEHEDDDASIDLDDQLYFPPEEKVIDISKHIRDLVHIEITINALCDPFCKGLCLRCGTNLNISNCTCATLKVEEKGYGPLGGLRKQMQQK